MQCVSKYYDRSNLWIGALLRVPLLLLATFGSGCAGPNAMAADAPHLEYADLNGEQRRAALEQLARLPAIVAFSKGEQIPVELALDSSMIALADAKLTLIAKRDFFLLLRPDGAPLLSEDGVDFERGDRPENYFFFGFGVHRDAAPSVKVTVGLRPDSPPGR